VVSNARAYAIRPYTTPGALAARIIHEPCAPV